MSNFIIGVIVICVICCAIFFALAINKTTDNQFYNKKNEAPNEKRTEGSIHDTFGSFSNFLDYFD